MKKNKMIKRIIAVYVLYAFLFSNVALANERPFFCLRTRSFIDRGGSTAMTSDGISIERPPSPEVDLRLKTIKDANIPGLIAEAHKYALDNKSEWVATFRRLAKENPFLVTGLIITQVNPYAVNLRSQLGQFGAPAENQAHPERLQQVADEVAAIQGGMARAFGHQAKRTIWLGMGGSASTGKALRASGMTPGLIVFDSTDPLAMNGLFEEIAHMSPEERSSLKTKLLSELETGLWVAMSMGMTSEEPVINLAYIHSVLQELGIEKEGGPNMRAITLANSSLDQFMAAMGWQKNLAQLQLDGMLTGPGRGSAPSLTKVAFWPLGFQGKDLNGLKAWNDRANISADTIRAFQELAVTMDNYVRQGRNKFTLVIPPELEGAAEWIKQIFEESEGRNGKGIYDQFLEQGSFQLKIITGEPLDEGSINNYRSADKSDRVFLVLNFRDRTFTADQEKACAKLKSEGYPFITLNISGVEDMPALWQGLHYTVATLVGYMWRRNFVTQPSVENYKAQAKKMIVEAMVKGGFIQSEQYAYEHPDEYFKALVAWFLREDPARGRIEDSDTYNAALGAPCASYEDGAIQIYFDRSKSHWRSFHARACRFDPNDVNADSLLKAGLDMCYFTRDDAGLPRSVEISHGGDLIHSRDGKAMRALMQEIATDLVRRPLKVHADMSEIPSSNHSTHEEITNERGLTILFMPREYPDPILGRYPPDYIRAQVIATKKALEESGRMVMLVVYPKNNASGREALERFKNAVMGYSLHSDFINSADASI